LPCLVYTFAFLFFRTVTSFYEKVFRKKMPTDNAATTDKKTREGSPALPFEETPAGDDAVPCTTAENSATADASGAPDTSASARLSEAVREIARLRDAHARALADLENYRRRVAREKEELRKFAEQGLIEDLIPITDNFAIGLEVAGKHPESAPVTDGFKMIAAQIKNTLEQHGLREINPLGELFDPNAHESVSQTSHAEVPEHHVVAVLRVGYRLHDRLVRPASVVLSTGNTPDDAAAAADASVTAPATGV
jgi:molecular chaperone GrpE